MTLQRIRKDCRLCGSEELEKTFDLEDSPPANEFVTESEIDKPQEKFPLGLWECQNCGHVQLPVVVSPDQLFRNYVYVSGTSPVFVDHFRKYAESLTNRANFRKGDWVIDIGSNDGTLLKFFKEKGARVLGVDPARDIAAKATAEGIETIPEFFTSELAQKISEERDIRTTKANGAKFITANNVFAHADDLGDIVNGVKKLLDTNGIFVFEVSYLVDVIEKNLFDTIYHEHLSYHHLGPLIKFMLSYNMMVSHAERIDTHGGSLRVYCTSLFSSAFGKPSSLVQEILEHEFKMNLKGSGFDDVFNGFMPLHSLKSKIDSLRDQLLNRLKEIKSRGKSVVVFGAPAKATTLMHHFKLGKETIDFVVDDSPLKQGLFTPGTHIPVVSSSTLYEKKPDYCVILAWNFAEPIMKNHQAYLEQGGKFIVPIPELKEYGTPQN